jgi:membrane protein CcdC involved in cytochrome C biogenesis
MLSYWFWPNPGPTGYDSPKVLFLLAFCIGMVFAALFVSSWRHRVKNPMTKRLSRSWPRTLRWLGAVGFVLTVSRAEGIQFFSMRILWLFWVVALLAIFAFQFWMFRRKHYTVVTKERVQDPRDKYLPGK